MISKYLSDFHGNLYYLEDVFFNLCVDVDAVFCYSKNGWFLDSYEWYLCVVILWINGTCV